MKPGKGGTNDIFTDIQETSGVKRSLKMDGGIGHRIIGNSHYEGLGNFAKNAGKWIKANCYPELKNDEVSPRDITTSDWNSYLEHLANTNVESSLDKYKSYIHKMQEIVNHILPNTNVDWKTNLVLPESKVTDVTSDRTGNIIIDGIEVKKGAVRPEHVKVIRDNMNGPMQKAVFDVFMGTGMRVCEMSNLRLKSVDFENNAVTVKGKGGKVRTIDKLDGVTVKALEYLCEGLKGNAKVVDRAYRTIGGWVLNAMVKAGIKHLYKKVGWHGVRKTYSQLFYDKGIENIPKETTEKEYKKAELKVVAETNVITGHRRNRGPQGVAPYVVRR